MARRNSDGVFALARAAAGLLLAATSIARASDFTVDAAASSIVFEATAVVAAQEFTADEQFPGSLAGEPFGSVGDLSGLPSSVGIVAGDEISLAELGNAAPGPGGAAGSAPADLAARVTSSEATRLPPFEGIELGTLISLDMDVAVRNAGLSFPESFEAPVDAEGRFDLSTVPLDVVSEVDARGSAILQSDGFVSYSATLIGLGVLQSQPDSPVESFDGDFFSLQIAATLADRVDLAESILLDSADAQLRRATDRWRLTTPLAFSVEQSLEEGFLDVRLEATGNLVAFSEADLIPGDANLDGAVDLADFALLKDAFGSDDWLTDFNGDLDVGLPDFSLLKDHFGDAAAVGEPGAGLLAISFSLVLAATRARRAS